MDKKTILFCGLGSIGQRHLRNSLQLLGDNVEVIAYRERNNSPVLNKNMTVNQGVDLKDIYPITEYYNLDEALDKNPDIVFVTNPNSKHLEVALKAAKRGCHLFIEKPVSHTLENVEELIKIVEEKKNKVFVAYQFRYHPALQKIKELLNSGVLGNILTSHIVNAEYLPDWHPYEDYSKTHPVLKSLGGGCMNIQTHELDYALWMFGTPSNVYAQGGKLSNLKGDAADSVDVLMNCSLDAKSEFPVHIHLDYLQWPHKRYFEIIGDLGKIEFDYYKNELNLYITQERKHEKIDYSFFERNQMFDDELKSFFNSIHTNSSTEISLKQGLESLQLADAIQRSLSSKKVVKFYE